MSNQTVLSGAPAMLLLVASFATGQDRMPRIPDAQWTPEQRAAADALRDTPNMSPELGGPYTALLRSPKLAPRVRNLGVYVRYENTLGTKLVELTVLMVARHWTNQLEWNAHANLAVKAGISQDTVKAIADGRAPKGLQEDEQIVYDFISEINANKSVSDTTYARALARWGEKGVVDLTVLNGHYSLLAMMMNVARTAVPNPVVPGLVPLPTPQR
jgi:4-carboxymuconolactone decarboxylase